MIVWFALCRRSASQRGLLVTKSHVYRQIDRSGLAVRFKSSESIVCENNLTDTSPKKADKSSSIDLLSFLNKSNDSSSTIEQISKSSEFKNFRRADFPDVLENTFLTAVSSQNPETVKLLIKQEILPNLSYLYAEDIFKFHSKLAEIPNLFDCMTYFCDQILSRAPHLLDVRTLVMVLQHCNADLSLQKHSLRTDASVDRIATALNFYQKAINLSIPDKQRPNLDSTSTWKLPISPITLLPNQLFFLTVMNLFKTLLSLNPERNADYVFQELRHLDQLYHHYQLPREHIFYEKVFLLLSHSQNYEEIQYWYHEKYQKEFLQQSYLPQQYETLYRFCKKRHGLRYSNQKKLSTPAKETPSSANTTPNTASPAFKSGPSHIQKIKLLQREALKEMKAGYQLPKEISVPLQYAQAMLSSLPKIPLEILQAHRDYSVEIDQILHDRITLLLQGEFPLFPQLPRLVHQQLFLNSITKMKASATIFEEYLSILEEYFPQLMKEQRREQILFSKQVKQQRQQLQQQYFPSKRGRAAPISFANRPWRSQQQQQQQIGPNNQQLAGLPGAAYETQLINLLFVKLFELCFTAKEWDVCILLLDSYLEHYQPWMIAVSAQLEKEGKIASVSPPPAPSDPSRQKRDKKHTGASSAAATPSTPPPPIDLLIARYLDHFCNHSPIQQMLLDLQQQLARLSPEAPAYPRMQQRVSFLQQRILAYHRIIQDQSEAILERAFHIMTSQSIRPPLVQLESLIPEQASASSSSPGDRVAAMKILGNKSFPSLLSPRHLLSFLSHIAVSYLQRDELPQLLRLFHCYSLQPKDDFPILVKTMMRRLLSIHYLPPYPEAKDYDSIAAWQRKCLRDFVRLFDWSLLNEKEIAVSAASSASPSSSSSSSSTSTTTALKLPETLFLQMYGSLLGLLWHHLSVAEKKQKEATSVSPSERDEDESRRLFEEYLQKYSPQIAHHFHTNDGDDAPTSDLLTEAFLRKNNLWELNPYVHRLPLARYYFLIGIGTQSLQGKSEEYSSSSRSEEEKALFFERLQRAGLVLSPLDHSFLRDWLREARERQEAEVF